jgi:hypothetical protein
MDMPFLEANGPIDRARVVDSTQVKTPDRGLRVQWFICLLGYIVVVSLQFRNLLNCIGQ